MIEPAASNRFRFDGSDHNRDHSAIGANNNRPNVAQVNRLSTHANPAAMIEPHTLDTMNAESLEPLPLAMIGTNGRRLPR